LCSDTLVVASVNDNDVSKAVILLRSTKSFGLDGAPDFVVKSGSEIFEHLLMFIFNLSLSTQTFPTERRKAAIAPVYKKGNKSSVSNYMPVVILNAF
jgi:hypothetical protein